MVEVKLGKSYLNKQGDTVKIVDIIDPTHRPMAYQMNKRFADEGNVTYTSDGFVLATRSESPFNLVEEVGTSGEK